MVHGITEDDLERIERFVQRPRCRRRPEMLCPGEEERGRTVDAEDGRE
jgi:hypothetical protein